MQTPTVIQADSTKTSIKQPLDVLDHLDILNKFIDTVDPHHPIQPISLRPQLDYLDVPIIAPKLPKARIINLTKNNMMHNKSLGHLAKLNNLIKTVKPSHQTPPIPPNPKASLALASSEGQSRSLDHFMETVLPQSTQIRPERALAPLVGSLVPVIAPHITSFMGKLLRPLIGDIANRPGVSTHKDALLQRFLPRALQGTSLANTQLEKALQSALQQQKYSVVLSTLKSQEQPLDTASYLPQDVPLSTLSEMQTSTRQIFGQFTRVIDRLLQKRLLSLNHFSTSFLVHW